MQQDISPTTSQTRQVRKWQPRHGGATARLQYRQAAFARLDAVNQPHLTNTRLAALADTSSLFVRQWREARSQSQTVVSSNTAERGPKQLEQGGVGV